VILEDTPLKVTTYPNILASNQPLKLLKNLTNCAVVVSPADDETWFAKRSEPIEILKRENEARKQENEATKKGNRTT